MNTYDAAQASILAGITASMGAAVAVYNGAPGFLAAAGTVTSSSSGGLESLLPQLGVFTVVIVVFKFMLGRQDQRDERSDVREDQVTTQLRKDIEALNKDLAREREAHESTRQKLIDTLLQHK